MRLRVVRAPLEIASGPTPRSLERSRVEQLLASESDSRLRARIAAFAAGAIYVPVVSPPAVGSLVSLRLRDRSEACGEVLWARKELPLAGAAVRYVRHAPGKAATTRSPSNAWDELIGAQGVPALPETARAILRDAGSARSGLGELAASVAKDKELSEAVIAMANSAKFRATERIRELRAAVVRLGLDQVRALALSASVFRLFPPESKTARPWAPDVRVSAGGLWMHSITCALCAEELARRRGLPAEDAFLSGLFHDLGKLLLAAILPAASSSVLDSIEERPWPVEEAERELLGFSHARAGSWILSRWGLSASIIAAVAEHHPRGSPDWSARPLAAVVHVADLLARSLAAGGTLDRTMPRSDPAAWESLGIGPEEIPEAVARCAEAVAKGSPSFEQAGIKPPLLEYREAATEADPILREAAQAVSSRRREELFELCGADPYLQALRTATEELIP